jgi:hypothetical protein
VKRSIAQIDFELPLRFALHSWEFWGAPGFGIGLTQRQFGVEPGPEILSQQRAVSWSVSVGARAIF